MQLDSKIYWDVQNLCISYANYKNNGGKKSFLTWYFPDDNSRVIKKIYFKEWFSPYMSLNELNNLANLYAEEYIKNKDIWFSGWYDNIRELLERKNKIEKIKNGYKGKDKKDKD